ncbi:MAG: hypothetical protein LHV68_12470 [Elusimicrobia bacterium]|nr:hypothetical protein [Candidatus Liberimonas magnetica]
MKYPSYGLIISLSIFLFFAYPAYTQEKSDENLLPPIPFSSVQDAQDDTMPVQSTSPEQEPVVPINDLKQTTPNGKPANNDVKQPAANGTKQTAPIGTKQTAPNDLKQPIPSDSKQTPNDLKQITDDLSKQINAINIKLSISSTTFASQLNEIKQKQDSALMDIDSIKKQSIKNQYEDLKSTTSYDNQISYLKKEQEDIMSMLIKLNENQEQLRDKVADLSGSFDKFELTKNFSTGASTSTKKPGLVPSKASIEEYSGQQYVKLKLLQDGQEVELYLDPTYVDMNLALPKTKKTEKPVQTDSKKDNTNIDKIMQYLSQFMDKKSTTTSQAQTTASAFQNPQTPSTSNTYNTANPQSDAGAPETVQTQNDNVQAKNVDNPIIADTQTLDDLLKAQKFFYEKKYNAALNSVQRSLAKQETALAYAIEGSIYFTMGDTDLAVSSWESALRINPNMSEVRKALFKYKR